MLYFKRKKDFGKRKNLKTNIPQPRNSFNQFAIRVINRIAEVPSDLSLDWLLPGHSKISNKIHLLKALEFDITEHKAYLLTGLDNRFSSRQQQCQQLDKECSPIHK